jgi:hypothetical protein
MNDSMQLISSIGSASIFLVSFPALWISGRIILRNYAVENRTLQIILWLSLGGLILIPLMDFIRYLGYVLYLIIPSSDKFGSTLVFLGMAPYMYYSMISLILGITVYGLAFYHVRNQLTQSKLSFIQGLHISNWEISFIILGIAGLVNRMVGGIVVNFVSIYFPSLTAQLDQTQLSKGFWISWLIGFIILIVTLFFMNRLLNRNENKLFSKTDQG